jgi:hypothetical protein
VTRFIVLPLMQSTQPLGHMEKYSKASFLFLTVFTIFISLLILPRDKIIQGVTDIQ